MNTTFYKSAKLFPGYSVIISIKQCKALKLTNVPSAHDVQRRPSVLALDYIHFICGCLMDILQTYLFNNYIMFFVSIYIEDQN